MKRRRSKLVICSPQLGISPTSFLGGEVHDHHVLKELLNYGDKVFVYLPKNLPFEHHQKLKVEFAPIKHIVPPHIFNILSIPYILRTYKRENFKILRIHSPYFLGLAGLIFKKIHPEVKVVTTIHLVEERIDLKFILDKTIHTYDHIFTVSNYLKIWLINEYKIEDKKISTIYNGFDTYLKPEKRDYFLIKKYKLKDKIVLLNLGLMDDRKNVLFLIELLERLIKKNPDIVLIFCGSGLLKNKILKTARDKKLQKNILILGPIFGKEKSKIYNLADIFLFPSKKEGFGLVGIEAAACGKPVIAADNTSLPEVLMDKKTGFLAKTSNIDDWENKLDILIQNDSLRKKMGEEGVKFVRKKFKWKKVALKTHQIYETLLKVP